MMETKLISEPQYSFFDMPTPRESVDEDQLDDARLGIRDRLSPTPTPVDELIRLTDFPPAVVQSVLLELELAGEISRYPGNRVAFC